MCNYKDLENIPMTNGKTIGEINREVRTEVERIYLEAWEKGVSVPIFDGNGCTILANPDGSEDVATFDSKSHTYQIIGRNAPSGCGRFAYLLNNKQRHASP